MTFLAHGVAAPDVFSTLAAFSEVKGQNGVQLGIEGIFGKISDSFITILESCSDEKS